MMQMGRPWTKSSRAINQLKAMDCLNPPAEGTKSIEIDPAAHSSDGFGSRWLLVVWLGIVSFVFIFAALPFNLILKCLIIIFSAFYFIALTDFIQGLYCYLAVLPFSYFLKRLLFLFPPVPQTEWFIATALPDLILVFAAIGLMTSREFAKHSLQFKNRSAFTHIPVVLFLLWCIFEIFNPNIPLNVGLGGFKKTAFYILIYFLSYFAVQHDGMRFVNRMMKITVIAGIVVTGYELYQHVFGFTAFEMRCVMSGINMLNADTFIILMKESLIRPFSTFSGPFILGDYLVLGMAFLFARYRFKITRKLAPALLFIILAVGLFWTVSRTSYLMLLLTGVFYAVLGTRHRIMTTVVLLASLLCVITVFVSYRSAFNIPVVQDILAPENFFGRMQGWQVLLNNRQVSTSLAGAGMGATQAGYAFGFQLEDISTHSFALVLLVELGLIGVALFALFFGALVKTGISAIKRSPNKAFQAKTQIILSILMGMILAKALSDSLWGQHIEDNYLWMLSGITAGIAVLVSRRRRFYKLKESISGGAPNGQMLS
jgi:hypothetical protein